MTRYACVGIDISAKTAEFQIQTPEGKIRRGEIPNTPRGHQQLLRSLTRKRRQVRVCLEATGVYGLDLAVVLARHPKIKLCILNPRQAKRFADVLKKRSKTDPIDAEVLCEYAQRMDFEAWEPPPKAAMQLRALGRRMHQLTEMKVQEKNRLHAATSSEELAILRQPIQQTLETLEDAIEQVETLALEVVNSEPGLRRAFDHLCSIRGVATTSAVKILGELSVLPKDMTQRQWVAHAGLDPRHHESGTSVHRQPRISKQGNRYLRAALYMPAHTAAHFEPSVQAFYERLVGRGKAKMQAKVAVMRKLLHAMHGMLRHGEDFDGDKFSPAALPPKPA